MTREQMREKCGKLLNSKAWVDADSTAITGEPFLPLLETFAREIRESALEEAASLTRPWNIEAYRSAIRALKDST